MKLGKSTAAVTFLLPGALFLLAMTGALTGCAADPAAKPAPAATDGDKPVATQPAAKADGKAEEKAAENAADKPESKQNVIRIKAGSPIEVTDADGNEWEAERGFSDGQTEDRSKMTIEGTRSPDLYRTERWGMTHFSIPLPNGKYTLRLHFCETWVGITAPGGRIFGVKVGDKEIKDLDVYKEAGGPRKPLVKTLETNVTDGKLEIQFVEQPDHNHPEINAIEIIPAGK